MDGSADGKEDKFKSCRNALHVVHTLHVLFSLRIKQRRLVYYEEPGYRNSGFVSRLLLLRSCYTGKVNVKVFCCILCTVFIRLLFSCLLVLYMYLLLNLADLQSIEFANPIAAISSFAWKRAQLMRIRGFSYSPYAEEHGVTCIIGRFRVAPLLNWNYSLGQI